jgi:nitroimidazol reductase NimA-like FMN-containing flavoprotein (pyridoxamine 5'-phosphate oxidase superfamily)
MSRQAPDRIRVRRGPKKGRYDEATIHAILDRGLFGHVAFVDDGHPVCTPMLYARVGGRLYVHGSRASRTMRTLADGAPACFTVTLLDGLVLARSVFEHSANYQAAMAFGTFTRPKDDAERIAALEAFAEKLIPGRWSEVRAPSRQELKGTTILSMPIEQASAKVRSGPPDDDDSPDAALPTWAGVIPVDTSFGAPVPSPGLRPDIPLSRSVRELLDSAAES